MRLKHANRLGMIFLVLAILILLVIPLSNTSFVIDNSVVSSYIVVPMMILPLLAIFTFKQKIPQKPTAKDILIGVALFALFVLITLALKSDYSQYFMQYRLDMLVFPLGVLAIIIVIFGMQTLRKFYAIILYPILASPLALFYILNGNSAFAQLNSAAVYQALRPFTTGLGYTPPFTISNSAFAVGIGTACAGLAIFIAIIAFMLPLAYLLNGKVRQKILWIIGAVLLLLIPNFLRMTLIAGVWLSYGPSSGIGILHSFAGIFLFYVAIIAMVLSVGLFGLSFPKIKKVSKENKKVDVQVHPYAIAILLSFAYLIILAI